MTCKSCHSQTVSVYPADIRFYLNSSRSMSAPPVNPSPKIAVCQDCGTAEFTVPPAWLASGWLRPVDVPAGFPPAPVAVRDVIHIVAVSAA